MLLEVMAEHRVPLHDIVADLQAKFGPTHYDRIDVRLSQQVPKQQMVQRLIETAPQQVEGETIARVDTLDGAKFYLADHSWLLIRPSGTEPMLRIYSEARTPEMRDALLKMGRTLGEKALG
jgi:phosphomannomutase